MTDAELIRAQAELIVHQKTAIWELEECLDEAMEGEPESYITYAVRRQTELALQNKLVEALENLETMETSADEFKAKSEALAEERDELREKTDHLSKALKACEDYIQRLGVGGF